MQEISSFEIESVDETDHENWVESKIMKEFGLIKKFREKDIFCSFSAQG